MGIQNHSIESLEKKNWKQIFNTLVKLLRAKDEELQSVAKTWKILEYKIKTQHENWIYDVRRYEEQLSLMRSEIKMLEKMRLLEIGKSSGLLGLKEGDCSLYKLKLEYNEVELNFFKAWFDPRLNENEENCNSGDGDECKSLEVKIRKLKDEFEKLACGKRTEVSSLLQETGFAWSQFRNIQNGFTEKLMEKDKEIKEANKMILSLQEQLQSSNLEKEGIISSLQEQLRSSTREKDKIISRLEAKVAGMEDNASKNQVKPLTRSRRLNPILT